MCAVCLRRLHRQLPNTAADLCSPPSGHNGVQSCDCGNGAQPAPLGDAGVYTTPGGNTVTVVNTAQVGWTQRVHLGAVQAADSF